MPAQLDGQRFCHVHQAGIAGAAAEIAGVAGVAAADVDDAAPARLLHERDDRAGAAQRADILDVEILDQILIDHGFDRTGRGGRAAGRGPAVDQDVQAAQLRCRLGDHAVDLLLAGDIGRERNDAPVRLGSQFPRRRLQIRLVPRHDRHIGPLASQFPRDGFADTPTAAGYDRMLALQSEIHGILSLVGVPRVGSSMLIVPFEGTWRKDCQMSGDALNGTTALRQSRRPSAIHRAHTPFLGRRYTGDRGNDFPPRKMEL